MQNLNLKPGNYTVNTAAGTLTGEDLNVNGDITSTALVFAFDSIVINLGATVTVNGSLPVVFTSSSSAIINGDILSNGTGYAGGPIPPPGDTSNGSGPGGGGYSFDGSGGGGGYAGAGGNGSGGSGGSVYAEFANLLQSGSGGGASGSNPGAGAAGAAGGGALQVTASGSLIVGGSLQAQGGIGGSSAGGGGGGAGGSILLSGSSVTITGSVDASGGAGGTGAESGGGGGGGLVQITSSTGFSDLAAINVSGGAGVQFGAPGALILNLPSLLVPFVVYTPTEVKARYNFPTNDAAGQTVGVLGWGGPGAIGVDVAALQKYFAGRHLPVPSIEVVCIGEQSNGHISGELEMDCEILGTFAENVAIRVYLALEQPDDIARAILQAVQDGCSVTTCSFGHPCAPWQDTWSRQAVEAIDKALAAAAESNVTTCFASGDSGGGAVAYPAASRWALAVGGTFVPVSTGVEQVWWNYSASADARRSWFASGGGVAPWQVPTYQLGVAPTSFSCCGAKQAKGRGTPDVAALAQGNGHWVGTSACSPFWAALIATINAGLGFQVGFINDILYGLDPASGALNKISTGNNIPPGTDCNPPTGQFPPCGYTASASGWDACTGLGTPNGQNLMTALGNAVSAKRLATHT